MIFIQSYTFYFCTFNLLGRVLHLQIYPLQYLAKMKDEISQGTSSCRLTSKELKQQ